MEPRLGQGTFRIAVADAYDRACAVTGEHTLPALGAAHIIMRGDRPDRGLLEEHGERVFLG